MCKISMLKNHKMLGKQIIENLNKWKDTPYWLTRKFNIVNSPQNDL